MTTEHTTEKPKQAIDYLEYFSQTIEFKDDELEEELDRQVGLLKEKNSVEGRAFEETVKIPGERWMAKEGIMHYALLCCGAIAVQDNADWKKYHKQLLSSTDKASLVGLTIRFNLLTELPSQPRDTMRASVGESLGLTDEKEVAMAQEKFDMRFNAFVDAFKKKHPEIR
jgi:hypothetical protein